MIQFSPRAAFIPLGASLLLRPYRKRIANALVVFGVIAATISLGGFIIR